MERFDTSVKIICLVEMAFKGEITWLNLDSLVDGLTPTLERSRQIIRILLKEFETHQSKCLINRSDDGNDVSEDIIEMDETQSNTNSVKAIEGSDYEEDGIQIIEEKTTAEETTNMKYEYNDSDDNEFKISKESKVVVSEPDSENEEVFDENDVAKNIQLVEAFKGQLYTFVGDDSKEKPKTDNHNKSLNSDKTFHQHKAKEVDSKIPKVLPREKRFECETCGKCFMTKLRLDAHIRIHTGEKPFLCKTCKKGFAHKSNLTMHEKIHTGERPFQCKHCKKGFMNSSNLKVHERIHTGEKPFQCKTCKKYFTRSNHLKIHERTHTGEKPFICKTCKKAFARKCVLKIHERTHTGEKSYQCKTCKKAFASLFPLKEHERIHTSEKPYQCKICGKTFSDGSNFRRHEENCHKRRK